MEKRLMVGIGEQLGKKKKRKQGKKKDFLGIEVREMGEAEQLNGRKGPGGVAESKERAS